MCNSGDWKLNNTYIFPKDRPIGSVKVRDYSSKDALAGLSFYDREGKLLKEISASDGNGQTNTYELEEGENIIGLKELSEAVPRRFCFTTIKNGVN